MTTALLTNKGRVARLHYHSMCVRSPGRLTVYIVSERGLEPGFSVMTRTAVRTFERRGSSIVFFVRYKRRHVHVLALSFMRLSYTCMSEAHILHYRAAVTTALYMQSGDDRIIS